MDGRRNRLVVVGSANADFVVVSERLPSPGETVTDGRFFKSAGGKGANQAVAAARLGADVTFVARLGSDPVGDEALAGYRREGIATDRVARDPTLPTGVALILVDGTGRNLISVASGANSALSPADVEHATETLAAADAVLLQLEVPWPAVARAIELADRAGVPTVLDPAPAPSSPLPRELLAKVGYLTPNETEAARLTGLPIRTEAEAKAAAVRIREAGPGVVLLTRGAAGVVVAGPDGAFSVEAFAVESVDSTAAGDAFNAAFAVAITGGASLEAAVRVGCAAGALTASRAGAQSALPTRPELDAFLSGVGL